MRKISPLFLKRHCAKMAFSNKQTIRSRREAPTILLALLNIHRTANVALVLSHHGRCIIELQRRLVRWSQIARGSPGIDAWCSIPSRIIFNLSMLSGIPGYVYYLILYACIYIFGTYYSTNCSTCSMLLVEWIPNNLIQSDLTKFDQILWKSYMFFNFVWFCITLSGPMHIIS